MKLNKIDIFSPIVFFVAWSFLDFLGGATYFFYSINYGASNWFDIGTRYIFNIDRFVAIDSVFIFLLFFLGWIFGCFIQNSKANKYIFNSSCEKNFSGSFKIQCFIYFLILILFQFLYFFHPGKGSEFRSALTIGLYGKIFFIVIFIILGYYQVLVSCYLNKNLSVMKLLFLFFLSIFTFFSFLQLGGRGRAILPILSFVIIYHYRCKRIPFVKGGVVALCVLLAILYLPFLSDDINYNVFDAMYGVQYYRNFDNFYNLSAVINEIELKNIDFTFGVNQICDILDDAGLSLLDCMNTREILMYNVFRFQDLSVGYPITKPGEFYMSFGYIGVLIGGVIIGRFTQHIYLMKYKHYYSLPFYLAVITTGGLADPGLYFSQSLVMLIVHILIIYIIYSLFFRRNYRVKII